MSRKVGDYETLWRKVVEKLGPERAGEVEEMIGMLMSEDPKLTRLGALYMLAEDLGVFDGSPRDASTIPIAKIVGGLREVNLMGRVIGLKGPIGQGGMSRLHMRLGDGTGKVNCLVWGDAASRLLEHGVKFGDCIVIYRANTRERLDGSVEVHVGQNGRFEVMDDDEVPPVEHFFSPLSEVLDKVGEVDFVAKVLAISEVRRIRIDGETQVMNVLLRYGRFIASMSVWRDEVRYFSELGVGEDLYIAAARSDGNEVSTTSRTCIHRAPRGTVPIEKTALLILDQIAWHELGDKTYIASDGISTRPIIVEGAVPRVPTVIEPFDEEYLYHKGRWITRVVRFELNEAAGSSGWFAGKVSLSNLKDGLLDVVVEGRLESKTELSLIKTKYGYAETVMGWLNDGEKRVFCMFWGDHARQVACLPSGSRIRLKWVKTRINREGEVEVHVDGYAKIEIME